MNTQCRSCGVDYSYRNEASCDATDGHEFDMVAVAYDLRHGYGSVQRLAVEHARKVLASVNNTDCDWSDLEAYRQWLSAGGPQQLLNIIDGEVQTSKGYRLDAETDRRLGLIVQEHNAAVYSDPSYGEPITREGAIKMLIGKAGRGEN